VKRRRARLPLEALEGELGGDQLEHLDLQVRLERGDKVCLEEIGELRG